MMTANTEVIEGYRLCAEQRRLWRVQPHGLDFRSACVVEISGGLSVPALKRGLQELVDRHEILRTSFQHHPGTPAPLQVIDEGREVECEEVDLRGEAAPEQERRVEELFAFH